MDELSLAVSKASTAGNGNRVSVACLACRTRHVRCDARQPACMRCTSEGRTCQYVKSRRGGLDRARLAERRRGNFNSNNVTIVEFGSPSNGSISSRAESGPLQRNRNPAENNNSSSTTTSTVPLENSGSSSVWLTEPEATGSSSDSDRAACSTPGSITDIQFSSIESDFLVKLFYKHFHRCHPCALPQPRLHRLYEESSQQGQGQESLTLLIAIMRFIGSMYSCKDLTSQLKDKVTEGFRSIQQPQHPTATSSPSSSLPDPFLVQCHLLYSIALYWSADKDKAREEIDAAIRIALNLGMHRSRFALDHARDDPLLQESLRRTWWQLYCTDAYYAAIKRKPTFSLCDVDTDTELPCEEDEYESGSIPTPKTLDDFDTREFAPENQAFSSFAYLIGATRSIALALSAGSPDASNWLSPKTIAEVDAIIDGWFLLLPKAKKEVLREGNIVDELMFQAHMAVHANLIALHRPFSCLPFHPLEGISSCLVEPPRCLPVKESETVHTQRCLQSIEAQLRLLVLPVQPYLRSPFTICMTAAGTNTLLAAIKVLYTGRQLAVARHQLRLVVGYIKDLAKVWPQGRHNLLEVQTIAQEVLAPKRQTQNQMQNQSQYGATRVSNWEGTAAKARQTQAQTQTQTQATPGTATNFESCIDAASLENWSNAATVDFQSQAQEDVEPFWSLSNDFQSDIPIWFSSCS